MNEFNTHEWRRKNIHENPNINGSLKELEDTIYTILSHYSTEINNSYGIPSDELDYLTKDLTEYITNNFTPKQ
jgi:hypothetical protein